MSEKYPNSCKDALERFVGRNVVIEGKFPIPIGQDAQGRPQIVYAPAMGRLTAVWDGGFDIVFPEYKEPTVFNWDNVRSVMPVPLQHGLVLPGPIGGKNA